MAVATRVTVATTGGGTAIYSDDGGGSSEINIRNRGSVSVYIGEPNVATTTGYQLDPGEAVWMRVKAGEQVYGITASTTCVVHVLKVEA